jgi:predicted nuclease of predicted toxin-antitoxin system
VKLLLDDMYSPDVAERLRVRGHDAIAIRERPDLLAMSDPELFAAMAGEDRTIVTNNVIDFVPLYRRALAEGSLQAALFLTSDRSMPRTKAGIGRFVSVLEEFATGESTASPTAADDTQRAP